MKKKIFIAFSLVLALTVMLSLCMYGCIRVYPGQENVAEGENFEEPPPEEHFEEHGEEPPPEEHHEEHGEEPPPEEHHEEEPPPEEPPPEEPDPGNNNQQNNNNQQSNLSEDEIKRRVFNAAQYEIEHNSIYKNVVFNTDYDPNFLNKTTGYEYTYECGIEFEALDTNVNKQGKFVWVFVVRYDPGKDRCYVESGTMQSEFWL